VRWLFIASDLKCVRPYGGPGNGVVTGSGYGDSRPLTTPSIRSMFRDAGDGTGVPEYSSNGYPSPSLYESLVVLVESA